MNWMPNSTSDSPEMPHTPHLSLSCACALNVEPTLVEKAVSLYESDESLLSVGENLGVAAHTVALTLRGAGVEIRKRRGY